MLPVNTGNILFYISPMVLFIPTNFESSINLLYQKQPYHLVRKGQFGKAPAHIGALTQSIGVAKRAADNKSDMAFASQRPLVK